MKIRSIAKQKVSDFLLGEADRLVEEAPLQLPPWPVLRGSLPS
jgi:hypothetical protein